MRAIAALTVALLACVPKAHAPGAPFPTMREALPTDCTELQAHHISDAIVRTEAIGEPNMACYILEGACSNWEDSLKIAQRVAGCGGEAAWDPKVRNCRKKIPAPCDICWILKDGAWPTASPKEFPDKKLTTLGATRWEPKEGTPPDAQVGYVHRDTPGTIPSAHVEFKRALCDGEANKRTLAKIVFHEALHVCKAYGAYGPATEDQSNPFVDDAEDITDECFD